MINIIKQALIIGISLFLTSCASISDGRHQFLTVTTGQETDAFCRLHNNKGQWTIHSTPGSATVERDHSDLTIVCKKNKMTGVQSFSSRTKGLAYGNIVLGGIIGAAVDAGSGSAYDYPYQINVDISE